MTLRDALEIIDNWDDWQCQCTPRPDELTDAIELVDTMFPGYSFMDQLVIARAELKEADNVH